MSDARHLRLAGVTRLDVRSPRAALDVFVFDPHRLALPCWALALEGTKAPARLLTLDRHFDLVPPGAPPPPRGADLEALDRYARWQLDVRNYDHVVAAMELGLVGDVVALARAHPAGAIAAHWTDRGGALHAIDRAPTLDAWLQRGGRLPFDRPVLLDLDLDCFTSPSDADPTTAVPWPVELVREYLLPPGSHLFWDDLLPRVAAVTIAREPFHCGGLVAGGRLFESFAQVFFRELLGADLP